MESQKSILMDLQQQMDSIMPIIILITATGSLDFISNNDEKNHTSKEVWHEKLHVFWNIMRGQQQETLVKVKYFIDASPIINSRESNDNTLMYSIAKVVVINGKDLKNLIKSINDKARKICLLTHGVITQNDNSLLMVGMLYYQATLIPGVYCGKEDDSHLCALTSHVFKFNKDLKIWKYIIPFPGINLSKFYPIFKKTLEINTKLIMIRENDKALKIVVDVKLLSDHTKIDMRFIDECERQWITSYERVCDNARKEVNIIRYLMIETFLSYLKHNYSYNHYCYEHQWTKINFTLNIINTNLKIQQKKSCPVCGVYDDDDTQIKTKTCNNCKKVRYCSRKCQKIHWKHQHNRYCKRKRIKFKIKYNKSLPILKQL